MASSPTAGRPPLPAWMWIASAFLLIVSVWSVWVSPEYPGGPYYGLLLAARLTIEGAALLWASGREGLPLAARRSFQLLGVVSLGSAITDLLRTVDEVRGTRTWPLVLDSTWYFLSYLFALIGVWMFPRIVPRARQGIVLLTDSLVTVGGFGALLWVGATMPAVSNSNAGEDRLFAVYSGLATLLVLAMLNRLVLQGQALPSRRAFWWFFAGQATYLPSVVLEQVNVAGRGTYGLGDVAYFLGIVPTLIAASYIRRDPFESSSASAGPDWFKSFNPLPLLVPPVLGGFLLLALIDDQRPQAIALGVALVITALLLLLRTMLMAAEHARLLQLEAGERLRVQAAKTEAIGRLAGGVAHEFNNLMTAVIGNADVGAGTVAPESTAAESFAAIRAAGTRAAKLTSQLLHFSGKQFDFRRSIDLAALVGERETALRAQGGRQPEIRVSLEPVPLVFGDAAQIGRLLDELMANAGEALPAGQGRIEVCVATAVLERPLPTGQLVVGPGRYVSLAVSDNGRGMSAEVLSRAFDPFFSTQPMHQAPGMGLASVYGIMAAHRGGIAVDSTPGGGTTVRCLFPVEASALDSLPK